MRLLVSLIRLVFRIIGFPITLLGGIAGTILGRFRWLRPGAQIGLKFLVVLKSNSIATTAITLSVINFGLLMWQIWPEDAGQTITVISQPTPTAETLEIDNTPGRIAELESQIRNLSEEQLFQFNRLIDCINYPTPFGCPRYTP